MVLEALVVLCVTAGVFEEKKQSFFFLIWPIKNLYYLLYSCRNPMLGKSLVLEYEPKWSQPITLQNF